jgi:hypothetical protein
MVFPSLKPTSRALHNISAFVLAIYLAVFSSAALVHAYAQDELTDTHGCLIGAWVQHADATDSVVPPLAPLACLGGFIRSSFDVLPHTTALGLASRGPPDHTS